MIGAAGAEAAQRAGPSRSGERQRFVGIGVVRDDAPVRRHRPAQRRQNSQRQSRAGSRAAHERRRRIPTRRGYRGRAGAMLIDELSHLIDRANAVQVALTLRGAPGKQPVAAENQSVCARVVPDRRFDERRQLETGPLPRHPDDAPAESAIELLELLPAVGRCGERDGPVGMQVIDVRRGKKRMQRRVDRGGDAVVAERSGRIVIDHLVFESFAAIAGFQLLQLVEVEEREPCVGNRAEIAAAAFHGKHANQRTCKRIGHVDLRARIAAAEVRDAQVRAEQIRTIAKERQLIVRQADRRCGRPRDLSDVSRLSYQA